MSVELYLRPGSLPECLDHLAEFRGKARLIAGGTDLMLQIRAGQERPEVLVDTSTIPGLDRLEKDEDGLVIGAGVTHARLASDPQVGRWWPALARACASVGSPQIRNVATLAGNVVNAQPAADGAVALVALGAQADIVSSQGERRQAVEELYAGLGRSSLDPTRELLQSFWLPPCRPEHHSAFGRIAARNALCLPTLNAAVWLDTSGGGIRSARIALGPVADRPFRPREAEASLEGVALDDRQALERAAEMAAREARPRDSHLRGSSEYRRHLVRVLVRRVLAEAAHRAGEGLQASLPLGSERP